MEIRLKVIETEEDYGHALANLERLFEAPEGTIEADQRDVLALLIEKYEEEHFPISPPSPLAAVKFRMEQQGLTPRDMTRYMGSKSKVSEVLSGKRDLSLSMIRALHEGLGIPAEVLLQAPPKPLPEGLDDTWNQLPVSDLAKNGAFDGFSWDKASLRENPEEAVRWLVDRAGASEDLPAFSYRKTDAQRVHAKLDRNALLAWCLQALKEAREALPGVPFDPASLTPAFIGTLVSLSVSDHGPQLAKDYLGKAGILVLAVPHLPRTYLDGATFWADGHPVIALTLRYDRLDNFWFVLLHELGHLVKGHLNHETRWIADDLDQDHAQVPTEREADQFALDALLPEDFLSSEWELLAPSDVVRYARRQGVHPAVVAGRLRHHRQNFRVFGSLLGHGEVRKNFETERHWTKAPKKE